MNALRPMPVMQKLLAEASCFPDPDPAESIRDIVSLVETWRMNLHLQAVAPPPLQT